MLHSKILELKHENSRLVGVHPVLDAFSLDVCRDIDAAAEDDELVADKRRSILSYLKGCTVGHDDRLKSALDEYAEAATYLFFKEKGVLIERVAEKKNVRTPDFRLGIQNEEFFVELKTLGFSEGSQNYIDALEQGLSSQAHLEQQKHAGKPVAIAFTTWDPLIRRQKKDYFEFRRKYFIETIVGKIRQNIKSRQLDYGKTILVIDFSLIYIPGSPLKNSIAFFCEPSLKSIISGLLWNIAFGQKGDKILSPIEFQGGSNIEGCIEIEGVLREFDFVKAICFQSYGIGREKMVLGFYRSIDEDIMLACLLSFCDFCNDELNSSAWKILQENR